MLSAGRPYPRQFVGQTSVAKAIAVFFASLLLLTLASNVVFAADPPPVQEFYVPVPEDQVFAALREIYPGGGVCKESLAVAAEPIITYISISVISDNTIIYYDHWEDDFEIDVSNPIQPSTEIWGDGDVSNGAAPGVPNDIINANTVIVLDTAVNLDDRQTEIDYDASDKVAATRMIAMTRAAWATGSGTLLAGALEVYPTDQWGTQFEIPVGEDVDLNDAANDLFEYTGLAVMATEDGTSLAIDTDGDGAADINTTIDEGESYLVNGDIQRGATVQASTRVQVSLITGDRCDIYESRWYVLFPTDQWSNSYYSPVGKVPASAGNSSNTQTTVFLYNPGPSDPLSVRYDVTGGSQTTVTVGISQTTFVMVPDDSGAHFYTTDGSPFAAIGAIDTGSNRNRDWDWGFTLVPESQLTRQTLIGWGPGQDPTSKPSTENGSPVWVMPVLAGGTNGPINICVDYNGDNIGSETDSNGFFYDQLLTLNELESVRVFDSGDDNDQTGMLLYVCEEPPPGAGLVTAWGAAPGIASDGVPGLDLGTTAPPAASFAAGKAAEVSIDADGDGVASPGDTLLYSVVIQNSSRVTVENVIISDTLPLNTTYVLSTTAFDDGSGAVPIPDDPPPGNGTAILPDPNSQFPLDDGGVALGDLPAGSVFTVTFQVGINDPFPESVDRVRNVAVVTAGGETTRPEVETPIFNSLIQIEKDVSAPWVQAGTRVTYTYEVRNIGNQPLHAVTVEDDKCSPLTSTGPDAGDDGVLSVGEVWTYVCSVVIERGTLNTATVTALDPLDKTVSDSDTAFVDVPILYLPIIKTPPPEPSVPPSLCPPPDGCPLENDIKGLAVHEGKNLLFVVTRNPDKLLVVNPDTFEIIERVETGVEPWGIVVNEQTNRVYVSNFAGGDVWIYDVDTLQVVEKLAVGTNPAAMAILPGLDTVFVLVRANSRVVILQGISLADDVPAGGSGPFGIAADTVNNRAYSSFRDSASFSLLRQQAGGWSAQTGPRFEDGRSLFGVAYNGNNGKLYSVFADSGGDWFVDIWMPNVTSPWGRVTTKSVPSGGVVSSPLVGGAGIAVNPATGNVFNVNTGDESVTVIDGDSEGILATIKLGTDPFPIAIDGTHNVVYVGLRAASSVVKIVDTY